MSATETLAQQNQEQKVGSERLTHEQLRREAARLAVLMILIAAYSSRENDHLFQAKPEEAEKFEETEEDVPEDNSAEILGLLNNALGSYGDKAKMGKQRASRYAGPHFDNTFASNVDSYREKMYAPGTPARDTAPAPDFTPAPSNAATPLGPQLPNLAFNDRIRPQGARPSDTDFAAAGRANEMYQRALFRQGWQGGEASAEQAKKAGRAVQREFHPDLPGTSAGDAEALKAFNAQSAKPVTPAEAGSPPPEASNPAPSESAGSASSGAGGES